MTITIATWNINSVRLRETLVLDFLAREKPDVLCLQEAKSPVDKIPRENFTALGYKYLVARGQKGYNGVATFSRVPIEDAGHRDFCEKGDARHVAARLEDGTLIHNYYVPAGGDEANTETNPKFAHKMGFLKEMQAWFEAEPPKRSILVGDLNIAPREDDVWDHKKLLKVVSHTPVEVEQLAATQAAGEWVDITRAHVPMGKLFSWWSYRARDWDTADKGRRLDHIWATPDIAGAAHSTRIMREMRGREKPSDHVPVFASFDL